MFRVRLVDRAGGHQIGDVFGVHAQLDRQDLEAFAAEKRCCEWLIEEMKPPKKLIYKDGFKDDALDRLEGLSEKSFNRAWAVAVKEQTTHPSWRKSGPIVSS